VVATLTATTQNVVQLVSALMACMATLNALMDALKVGKKEMEAKLALIIPTVMARQRRGVSVMMDLFPIVMTVKILMNVKKDFMSVTSMSRNVSTNEEVTLVNVMKATQRRMENVLILMNAEYTHITAHNMKDALIQLDHSSVFAVLDL
jgi:hypothetical protein